MNRSWRLMGRITARFRGQRGAVLVLAALGMAVFLGMVALAVDVGRLLAARTEAQRVADAAALAGASAFIYVNDATLQASTARAWAKDYAARNIVSGTPITLRDQDIDILAAERKVRVRVLRTVGWGGPVSTVFASVFGTYEFDVSTSAAAEASFVASNVSCPLPIVVPDDWLNSPGPEYDPAEGDIYVPPFVEQFPGGDLVLDPDGLPIPSSPYYGFLTEQRLGDAIVLKPSQGGATDDEGRLEPGFWDLWLPIAFSGVPPIRQRILTCQPGEEAEEGDWIWAEKGNKQTLATTFQELIDLFPNEEWDPGCKCPVVKGTVGSDPPQTVESMRYRSVPYLDPRYFDKQGAGPHFQIAGFGGMWVEKVVNEPDDNGKGQLNVYARVLKAPGNAGNTPGAGPLVLALRLVE